ILVLVQVVEVQADDEDRGEDDQDGNPRREPPDRAALLLLRPGPVILSLPLLIGAFLGGRVVPFALARLGPLPLPLLSPLPALIPVALLIVVTRLIVAVTLLAAGVIWPLIGVAGPVIGVARAAVDVAVVGEAGHEPVPLLVLVLVARVLILLVPLL